MRRSRWVAGIGITTLMVLALRGPAQQFLPHVAFVYPAGGQAGTTVRIKVGGQHLAGTVGAYVSGKGAQAKIVETDKLYTQKEKDEIRGKYNTLKRKLDDAAENKKERDPKEIKELGDLKKMLDDFKRKAASALAESVTVEVTLAADAEPGERELRLRSPAGLSRPLPFHVGTLREYVKPRPPEKERDPDIKPDPIDDWPVLPPSEMKIEVPCVINGQILPGGVDRYRFRAKAGQQIVVVAQARALVPYIADAVPGWFQATVSLHDGQGKELACDDHYSFRPDPVFSRKIPADGEYLVEIRDAIYRGRDDFVYRLTVGEIPFVTGHFPLGGPDRDTTTVHLQGWNLPTDNLILAPADKRITPVPLSVRNGLGVSNRVPFLVDQMAEVMEQEPNDDRAQGQVLKWPVVVNGRIERPGDRDVYKIEGRFNEELAVEVQARSLESVMDAAVILTDEKGKIVAYNDDAPDKRLGMHTHAADASFRVRLPSGGTTFYLTVTDAQNQGGPNCAYRLRISNPRPDFALRVTPASLNARPGTCIPLTVHAVRREGFTGAIDLELKNAPKGFALGGAEIPAGTDSVRLTLTVPPTVPDDTVPLAVEGKAVINERVIAHPAVPAEDMMQAFAYHHLVPAKGLFLAVMGRGQPAGVPLRLLRNDRVKLYPGGVALVIFVIPPGAPPLDRAKLTLSEPPPGITLEKVDTHPEGLAVYVKTDAAKCKPGTMGNLIIDSNVELARQPQVRRKVNFSRTLDSTLPAVPYQVVGRPKPAPATPEKK